ncbi:hypothetical protein [Microbulbifer discodermiae]|uniref:hypothetical protein n=1 Tax=Microbulbifer sp. 2201CG32-9 TaxID=3232309 RepID=UPI00345C3393
MISILKKMLKKGLKLPLQFVRRHNAKKLLPHITSHENLKLKAIGIAIQEALTKNLSSEEQQAISLIEERRASLLNSGKKIVVVDYGAGSPNSNRTKKEMEIGVQSTALGNV